MKSILIIRFSSIGDIILTTSVLNLLHQQFPGIKIDFLTLENFAPLLFNHPAINKLLILPKNTSPKKIRKYGFQLDAMNYDIILDLHNTLRSKLIMSGIVKTQNRKLKKPRLKRFLLFYLTINRFKSDFNQIGLLHTPLKGIINEKMGLGKPSLMVTESEKNEAKRILQNENIDGKYGVCVPGAAWPNKIWPVDYYIELFSKKVFPEKWILLGGKNDKICEVIANSSPHIIDLHGKTDLRESLAILSNAKIVFGSDTGMVHAAEALGVPVVTIMGPTSRETGAGVTREFSSNVEKNDIWCRPCSQNGKRKCYRKEQYCMTGILPDEVHNTLNSLLELE